MTAPARFIIGTVFQAALLALGIYALYIGKVPLGCGLIAVTLATFVFRGLKTKKVREQQKRGLNPYDERTYYITGKAAYAAYNTFIIVSGLFVLGGSIFGPQVLVNPYNTIGFAMAVLVLLHLGFYYYYNSKE
ncbi:MAG: hypothetical protein ACOX3D_02225 [Syntrophomonadales bacterium]|jgi:uncharacterized membrane protein